MARHLGRGGSPLRRVGMVGRFVLTAGRSVQTMMQSHCQSASELADRLALGSDVCAPLLQAFERWDGKGVPGSVGGDDVALAMRLVHLADAVEAFHHTGGVAAAVEVAEQRRGTQFDPVLVDCFVRDHAAVLAGLGEISAWDEVIALDPRLGEQLSEDGLDARARGTRRLRRPEVAVPPRPLTRRGRARGRRRRARSGCPRTTTVVRAPGGVDPRRRDDRRLQRGVGRAAAVVARPARAGPDASVPDRADARRRCRRWRRCRGARRCTTSASTGPATHVASAATPSRSTARVLAAADVCQALGEARPHRAGVTAPTTSRRSCATRCVPGGSTARRSTPCCARPVTGCAAGRDFPPD